MIQPTTPKRPMPPTTQAGYWALVFAIAAGAVAILGMSSGSPVNLTTIDLVIVVGIWAAIGWVVGIVVALIRLGLRKADQTSQAVSAPFPTPVCPHCGNWVLDRGQDYVGCRRCGWWTR